MLVPWWEALVLGLVGGAVVELLDFLTVARARRAWPCTPRPNDPDPPPSVTLYVTMLGVRLALGGILAMLLALAGQATTVGACVLTGLAAPAIIRKYGALTEPVTGAVHAAPGAAAAPPAAHNTDGAPEPGSPPGSVVANPAETSIVASETAGQAAEAQGTSTDGEAAG